jgi:hypothetical protein
MPVGYGFLAGVQETRPFTGVSHALGAAEASEDVPSSHEKSKVPATLDVTECRRAAFGSSEEAACRRG